MKLLAWNLNHRAARRRIPAWIATTIAEQSPDVLILTEYVEGPDHASFRDTLRAQGLGNYSLTSQPGGENQLLIASRDAQHRSQLNVPNIHPSVPPNVLEVSLKSSELTVLGFRMPAFKPKDRVLKRQTWNWLLSESDRLRARPALIVGDFNTAPGDSKAYCVIVWKNSSAAGGSTRAQHQGTAGAIRSPGPRGRSIISFCLRLWSRGGWSTCGGSSDWRRGAPPDGWASPTMRCLSPSSIRFMLLPGTPKEILSLQGVAASTCNVTRVSWDSVPEPRRGGLGQGASVCNTM
jgi:Exonuclease III